MKKEFDRLIGRCRCSKHAEGYVPRSHNQSRTYYFLPEDYVSAEFLCGACMQNKGEPVHGGLVISDESRRRRIVVFEAFGGYHLTEQQINSVRKIWPKP